MSFCTFQFFASLKQVTNKGLTTVTYLCKSIVTFFKTRVLRLVARFYPQRGERGGRRPPSERRRGPEGTEETKQSLKESEEIQIL